MSVDLATAKSAADVARLYSESAEWVPVGRALPPLGEEVFVLYADGIVDRCSRGGIASSGLFIDRQGRYRYVDVAFWRPIK